jgi:RNA polymerase sigma factor (sigma-70 family)
MPHNTAPAEVAPVPVSPELNLFDLKQEYLGGQTGRLLTPLEETGLSGIIHAGRQAANALTAPKSLTQEVKLELERTARQGRDAFDIFFSAHRGLVKGLATALIADTPEAGDPDDVIQVGYVELGERIVRFDPTTELGFSAYATPYIRGNMISYVLTESAMARADGPAYNWATGHDDEDDQEVDALDVADGSPWAEDSKVEAHDAKLAVAAIVLVLRRVAESYHAGGKSADPDRAFKILVAHHVEGRSLADIASDFQISRTRVHQLISKAETALENRLSAKDRQNISILGYGTVAERRQRQQEERRLSPAFRQPMEG